MKKLALAAAAVAALFTLGLPVEAQNLPPGAPGIGPPRFIPHTASPNRPPHMRPPGPSRPPYAGRPRPGPGPGGYYRPGPPHYYGRPGPRYHNGYRGYSYYRPGYRRYDGWWYPAGAFAAGALIGGAIAAQPHYSSGGSEHVNWCYNRWRSYRASDNTYQPSSGPRRQCVSPYS
ncbi:BA14K family protein [Ancylobacter sp. 6x-1]|uniref:Lectin-like protein BA14k n=1 Tax=Ancylobacter crimeensis TaxID=2579147 RepID=A0ABT0DEJ4_9HYPH|nr:BA14K family protein [Ancylobacter crimeensis]MCK0198366.1 BA14K family protein [Ancylobacter crimeensis]